MSQTQGEPIRGAAGKQSFRFPELEARTEARPRFCRRCGSAGRGRHRRMRRPVVDLKVKEIAVVQYQCCHCGASVTVLPPGIQEGCQHSERTKLLSVVLWGLGLSYGDGERVMKGLGVPLSDGGVLLKVRAMGAEARRRHKKLAARMKSPVLGADETQVKLSGNGVTLGFLTNPETGEIVGMEMLASREGEALARWLREAAQRFGAKALVTDELESYKPAAEAAGLEHQLCLAHWRKAVSRRLKKIEGYAKEKELIKDALKALDRPAQRALRWLHAHFTKAPPPRKGERQSPAYAIRMLTLDCLENTSGIPLGCQRHPRGTGIV